jgi:type I restriction enzyme, S subunit
VSFPRYPNYKDSGVEWLGDVPAHWVVTQLKRVVDPERQITYGIVQAGPHVPEGIPYVRPADMTDEQGILSPDEVMRTSSEIASAYSRSTIRTGDLVCSIGPSFGKVMVAPSALDGANLTQGTARIAVQKPHNGRYLFWTLRSPACVAQWESSVGGATFRALNLGPLSETNIAVPDENEQTLIAAFLDRETGKIDGLVSEQRRLMELLQEKRQAVITRAVTQGLDPNVPMTPSGIEWLGNVPKHWQTRTIAKASTKITNGYVGPTRDILVEAGIPYIQATHIKGGRITFDDGYFVTREWSSAHAKSILDEEDVLIVQTGAGTGDVGLVSANEVGFNCHALIIVTSDKSLLRGSFLSSVLQSTYGQEKLTSIETGAMHPHLNCGEVKFVEVPLPPLAEQADIVAYIRDTADRFDTLTAEAQHAIDLLQERRTALISAAVTGQIDVRSLVESETA